MGRGEQNRVSPLYGPRLPRAPKLGLRRLSPNASPELRAQEFCFTLCAAEHERTATLPLDEFERYPSCAIQEQAAEFGLALEQLTGAERERYDSGGVRIFHCAGGYLVETQDSPHVSPGFNIFNALAPAAPARELARYSELADQIVELSREIEQWPSLEQFDQLAAAAGLDLWLVCDELRQAVTIPPGAPGAGALICGSCGFPNGELPSSACEQRYIHKPPSGLRNICFFAAPQDEQKDKAINHPVALLRFSGAGKLERIGRQVQSDVAFYNHALHDQSLRAGLDSLTSAQRA